MHLTEKQKLVLIIILRETLISTDFQSIIPHAKRTALLEKIIDGTNDMTDQEEKKRLLALL